MHVTIHQTNGTVHQKLPKILMKVHGIVNQTNVTVHYTLPKILMNIANNHP